MIVCHTALYPYCIYIFYFFCLILYCMSICILFSVIMSFYLYQMPSSAVVFRTLSISLLSLSLSLSLCLRLCVPLNLLQIQIADVADVPLLYFVLPYFYQKSIKMKLNFLSLFRSFVPVAIFCTSFSFFQSYRSFMK